MASGAGVSSFKLNRAIMALYPNPSSNSFTMVVPPQFSLAFKSVIYGTGVGLATTLLSCTLAVAVEKTAINYMYMYKVRKR